jgi:parvulin-like peptidyl-prolyl isomerase
MGMMTRMRDNAHVFIIAFAVVFIAFWVVSDVDLGSWLQGGQNDLAKIDGRVITAQEFQKAIDERVEAYRKQNNNKEPDEATMARIREEIWNQYISEAVIKRAAKEFGLTITDQDKVDWMMQNPPEELQQFFSDSTGQFRWNEYHNWLRSPNAQDRQWLNAYLLNTEKRIETGILQSKLVPILFSSVLASDLDVRSKFIDENSQVSARFVFFDPRVVAGQDTAKPSDDEYKKYYDRFKDDPRSGIKMPYEMRRLKYVVFNEKPSNTDSADVQSQITEVLAELKAGKDFAAVAKERSTESGVTEQWASNAGIPPAALDAIFNNGIGNVVGPVDNENGVSLFKVIEEKALEGGLTAASHILIKVDAEADGASQKAKAEEIIARAKAGEDFAALARQYSEDPGSGSQGGKLGWFGKGRMVPEFENACKTAKVNEIVGPVKSQFGYHIIKVTGRTSKDYKISEIRLSVQTSTKTRNEVYERARDFAYYAKEHDFETEAKNGNLQIVETPDFSQQSGAMIPGIGLNASLVNFTFTNKVGALSGAYRSNTGYVVCVVSNIREKGYRPLEDVKEQLTPLVIFDRQMRATFARARELRQQSGSLEEIAAKMPGLRVDTTGQFLFKQGAMGIGRDDAVHGVLLSMKPGEVSRAFKGRNGVYVLQLVNMQPFDEGTFSAKREDLRKQLISQQQQEFIRSWFEEMKQKLDLQDHRERFYR